MHLIVFRLIPSKLSCVEILLEDFHRVIKRLFFCSVSGRLTLEGIIDVESFSFMYFWPSNFTSKAHENYFSLDP